MNLLTQISALLAEVREHQRVSEKVFMPGTAKDFRDVGDKLASILATASEQAPVAWGVMYPANHPQAGEVWHTFPDQRDAKAAREAAWNGDDDLIVPLYTSPAHTSETRDSQRLEWLFDPNFYVGCRFDLGFYVEGTLSGKVITSGHATHREAIDAAMRQEAE